MGSTSEADDIYIHILRNILLFDVEDLERLSSKKIHTFAGLKHMTFSRLQEYKNDGTLADGPYEELRLFLMYLQIYKPTMETLLELTGIDWTNMDHVDLQERFYGLQFEGISAKPKLVQHSDSFEEPTKESQQSQMKPSSQPTVDNDFKSDFSSEHVGTTVAFPTPVSTEDTPSEPPHDNLFGDESKVEPSDEEDYQSETESSRETSMSPETKGSQCQCKLRGNTNLR